MSIKIGISVADSVPHQGWNLSDNNRDGWSAFVASVGTRRGERPSEMDIAAALQR